MFIGFGFFVTIRGIGSCKFTIEGFCLVSGFNLATGVLRILLINNVFKRHEFIVFSVCGIHAVVDSNILHIIFRE